MSRQDDLALTGQGIGETPRMDKAWGIYQDFPHDDDGDPWGIGAQLERELNQAIRERDMAQLSLKILIALHEREIETGQPISGEDWEIAGYALTDK